MRQRKKLQKKRLKESNSRRLLRLNMMLTCKLTILRLKPCKLLEQKLKKKQISYKIRSLRKLKKLPALLLKK